MFTFLVCPKFANLKYWIMLRPYILVLLMVAHAAFSFPRNNIHVTRPSVLSFAKIFKNTKPPSSSPTPTKTTRRNTFVASLLGLSTILNQDPKKTAQAYSSFVDVGTGTPSLRWQQQPYNIRTGSSIFDPELTYNVRFITYLSRFLLSFDPECQRWVSA